ncbi:MAG: hypothetical protein JKX73_00155, partial [Flavobacteriales bacterium]|nr:hypothetical protein [Flavobacteriales bacterium]
MMRITVIVIFFLGSIAAMAQDKAELKAWEDSLVSIAPAILNGESDAVKYQAHEQFKGIL